MSDLPKQLREQAGWDKPNANSLLAAAREIEEFEALRDAIAAAPTAKNEISNTEKPKHPLAAHGEPWDCLNCTEHGCMTPSKYPGCYRPASDVHAIWQVRDKPLLCAACGDDVIDFLAAWTDGRGTFWHRACKRDGHVCRDCGATVHRKADGVVVLDYPVNTGNAQDSLK
jgi:hypothetical protein